MRWGWHALGLLGCILFAFVPVKHFLSSISNEEGRDLPYHERELAQQPQPA